MGDIYIYPYNIFFTWWQYDSGILSYLNIVSLEPLSVCLYCLSTNVFIFVVSQWFLNKIKSYMYICVSRFSILSISAFTDNLNANIPLGGYTTKHSMGTPPPIIEEGPVNHRPTNPLSSESSNKLLYMILGIVLGIMLILLIVFMIMCSIKQKQQRRQLGESCKPLLTDIGWC